MGSARSTAKHHAQNDWRQAAEEHGFNRGYADAAQGCTYNPFSATWEADERAGWFVGQIAHALGLGRTSPTPLPQID